MKEVRLKELMDLAVVVLLRTTLLKMLNPVETCILNLWSQTLLYMTAFNVNHKHARATHTADILLERAAHKLYAANC